MGDGENILPEHPFLFFLKEKKKCWPNIYKILHQEKGCVLLSEMSTKYTFHNNTESSAKTDSDLWLKVVL